MFCFFFQAEDGIRDYKVTGVQTCALPISRADGDARDARARHDGHLYGGARVEAVPSRAPHAARRGGIAAARGRGTRDGGVGGRGRRQAGVRALGGRAPENDEGGGRETPGGGTTTGRGGGGGPRSPTPP